MKNYKFIVTGLVQGVYYRKSVKEACQKAGFNGYVKNLTNGDVEACVTCEEELLKKFLKILKSGSSSSIVKDITVSQIDNVFSGGFEIRY